MNLTAWMDGCLRNKLRVAEHIFVLLFILQLRFKFGRFVNGK